MKILMKCFLVQTFHSNYMFDHLCHCHTE